MQYGSKWLVGGMIVTSGARFAAAQAPGASAPDPALVEFEACKQQRSAIYAQATSQTDMQERTRLLQSMPDCKAPPPPASPPPPPPAFGVLGPVAPLQELPPLEPHAAETSVASITVAPLSMLVLAAFGGIALDGRVEGAVADHVGLGLDAAYGSFPALLSEDVDVDVWLVAPRATWYTRRFSGFYASGTLIYGHAHNGAGTGFFGGEVHEGDMSMYGAAAYGGWKFISRAGATVSIDLGAVLTRFSGSGGSPESDLEWGGSFHVGWSFGSTAHTRARFEADARAYQQREAERMARAQRRQQAWFLTQQAGQAARANDCARVAAIEPQVLQLDAELYASAFARDAGIVRCMTPPAPTPVPPIPAPDGPPAN